jgi:hypothetical protein
LLLLVASAVVLLTVTALADAPSAAPTSRDSTTAPAVPTVPTPPPSSIYISASHSGHITANSANDQVTVTASSISFKSNDILRCTLSGNTCTWDLLLTGSAMGISGVNLRDFEVLDNGDILFTIDRTKTLVGIGKVTPRDVLRYHAGGGLSIELAGSTIGLTRSSEDIDAVAVASDGKLVISTIGTATINGVGKVRDRDLVKIDGTTGSLYFDGSSVGLTSSSEDIAAAWIGKPSPGNNLYLVTKGNFSVNSTNALTGKKSDIFGCSPATQSPINSCFFYPFFSGKANGLDKQIDGLSVVTTGPIANAVVSTALQSFAASSVADDPEDAPFNLEEYTAAMNDNNPDISAEDFIDVQGQVFLPLLATR